MHVLIDVTKIFTQVWNANAVSNKKYKYMGGLCIYNIHLVTTYCFTAYCTFRRNYIITSVKLFCFISLLNLNTYALS